MIYSEISITFEKTRIVYGSVVNKSNSDTDNESGVLLSGLLYHTGGSAGQQESGEDYGMDTGAALYPLYGNNNLYISGQKQQEAEANK